MKVIIKTHLLTVAGMVALAALAGCAQATNSAITGVTMSNAAYNLEVGGSSGKLTASVTPASANQTVTWSSGNSAIATVASDGTITGVSAGTTMITATASDGKTVATCGTAVWQTVGLTGNLFLKYYNSDTAFYSWSFYHIPTISSSVPLAGNPIKVILNKVTGASDEAFGVYFCYIDGNNFYKFTIATNGWYHFQKTLAGVTTEPVPWTTTTTVLPNNQPNTVILSQPSAGVIAISVNGTPLPSVNDSAFSAGKIAFYASNGKSNDTVPEVFPSVPEDIRFQLVTPITYP